MLLLLLIFDRPIVDCFGLTSEFNLRLVVVNRKTQEEQHSGEDPIWKKYLVLGGFSINILSQIKHYLRWIFELRRHLNQILIERNYAFLFNWRLRLKKMKKSQLNFLVIWPRSMFCEKAKAWLRKKIEKSFSVLWTRN